MQHYAEDLEGAKTTASHALEAMAAHEIAPTPPNYTVWYRYVAGADPELVSAIDRMIEDGTPFTPERNAELFSHHVGDDAESEALRTAGNRLQTAVEQVLTYVNDAGVDTSAYGDRLEHLSGGLEKASRAQEVEEIARILLTETQQILSTSNALERQLGESSREIDALRQHLETMRHEALTDSLTGLANRKAFDLHLAEAAREAEAEGEPLSLLLADIDHFKAFNDSYGHAVGDEVLKVVARRLKEGVKGRDTTARYGGEEFTVILPNTHLEGAMTVAEQLRAALASKTLRHRRTQQNYGTVTLSIGAALYRPGESLGQLLQRADEALYRAKAGGRNRVQAEVAQPPASLAS